MSNYYDPAPPRRDNAGTIILVVVLVILGIVVLSCGGLGVLAFVGVRAARQEVQQQMAQIEREMAAAPAFPDPMDYNSLQMQQDYAAADARLESLLAEQPDNVNYLNERAWMLATCPNSSVRNGELAVELATRACDLTSFSNAMFIDTLAAAYAESGDFEKAIEYQQQAMDVNNEPSFVSGMQNRMKTFEEKRPYREGPNQQPWTGPDLDSDDSSDLMIPEIQVDNGPLESEEPRIPDDAIFRGPSSEDTPAADPDAEPSDGDAAGDGKNPPSDSASTPADQEASPERTDSPGASDASSNSGE